MFKVTLFVVFVMALAGWAITSGSSTGPGDYRSTYFSNSGSRLGPAHSSEQVAMAQQIILSLRY
jgi:hypothetical protein